MAQIACAPTTPSWFWQKVLAWYAKEGRHDLPWKEPRCAYRIWVSEIMLQQTQVATVIPYFTKFMQSFPNVASLAKATTDSVLNHWAGLGYYARGRNLHKASQIIVQEFKAQFPNTVEELVTLPGIGLSTAGAIVAQAFDRKATICDGNVKRVLSRFHCVNGPLGQKDVENILWDLAVHYTPSKHVADYTQAIMDIGATICTRTRPQCNQCPLQTRCQAYKDNTQLQFPQRKRSKRLPTKEAYFLCVINAKNEILLFQRPDKGIWGGLWSLPEFESLSDLQAFVKPSTKSKRDIKALAELKHTFTHFHLLMKPHLVQTNLRLRDESLQWISAKKLSTLGLPAPIKKLLHYDIIGQKMGSL